MQFLSKNVLVGSILIVTNLILAGCGSKHDPKDEATLIQVTEDKNSGYSEASCLYGYNQGPSALAKNSANIQPTFFGKNIDVSLLSAVLGASMAEVVRFGETTGVVFYKTAPTSSATSCNVLAPLPQTPNDIESSFIKAGNSVLGLYLGLKTPGLVSTQNLAAITVRSDANKWVLVHEYMHHLFEIQATAEGLDVAGLKQDIKEKLDAYDQAVDAFDSATSTNRAALIQDLAVKLVSFNTTAINFIKQYYLEEMTIETVLAQKLENGSLRYALAKQRINGAAYTITSAKNAKDLLGPLKTATQKVSAELKGEILLTKVSNQLDLVISNMESIDAEITNLSNKATKFLLLQGLQYNGLRSGFLNDASSKKANAGCSHGEIPADVVDAIKHVGRGVN